jgi:hypothetical protein
MPERIEAAGDVWAAMKGRGRSLKSPMEKLQRLR